MRLRLTTLLLFLLLAPNAQAGVRWVVSGHGFGHGVGMSQYGAYGYAKHGKGYRFILGHYYSGTTIGTLSGAAGRARAARRQRRRRRRSATRPAPAAGRSTRGAATSPAGSAAAVQLRAAGGRALANCGRKLRAAGRGRVSIGGSVYRGALEVVPTAESRGSLNAVNALPVDQYVKGVVPNESPASWPLAALEAQAVAARSYALADQVGGNGFDLYADTRSQVYGGLESEARAGQPGGGPDEGAGGDVRGEGRGDVLLRLLGRAHRERRRTSSSARRSPTSSASPTPTTAPARCTPGSSASAAARSAPSSAPT